MRQSKLNEMRSGRSLPSVIAVTFVALLAVSVPVLLQAGHKQRERFSTQRDTLKRHAQWLLVGRALWKGTRRMRVWLPVVLTLLTWRSQLKHATSRRARSAE